MNACDDACQAVGFQAEKCSSCCRHVPESSSSEIVQLLSPLNGL